MKLTVKLDFGCGREIKVGTFSEIGRDTAFEFAGEFLFPVKARTRALTIFVVLPRMSGSTGMKANQS